MTTTPSPEALALKPFERDENGVLHVLALSGGHDSSSLAIELRQREPRPYTYVCTPTGDESPEMFAHWRNLGERLGALILPIMAGTLDSLIRQEGMIPNFRARFCTRRLKIEPFIRWLREQLKEGPVVAYIGLRADEPNRIGGVYGQLGDIETRCPLREWGWGEDEVQASLRAHGIKCPDRTDCLKCYHQRIGEWWECWAYHRDVFYDAVNLEAEMGATFRTPGRDSWPTALKDMAVRFEAGEKPMISLNRMARERQAVGNCRVCTL